MTDRRSPTEVPRGPAQIALRTKQFAAMRAEKKHREEVSKKLAEFIDAGCFDIEVPKFRLSEHISEHELYTVKEILRRLGIGAGWMREARKKGLRTIKAGARICIHGKDLIEYLRNQPAKGETAE